MLVIKNMYKKIGKKESAILIGNLLENFDTAIYALLAPIFAPEFFPKQSYIVQLILSYSILASTVITKPLGSIIFGNIVIKKGIKNSLAISLLGVSICSVIVGLIPSYNSIGVLAPISLLIVRMLLGIFSSGEASISKLYILEGCNKTTAIKNSSLYGASTISGIILASILANIITSYTYLQSLWRIAFYLGSLTGFAGLYLRKQTFKRDKEINIQNIKTNSKQTNYNFFFNNKKKVITIIITSGFSYITYALAFIFINSFIPKVTTISYANMLSYNSIFLLLDLALISIIYKQLSHYNTKNIMLACSLLLAISSTPFFTFLSNNSILYINIFRAWVILIGVTFSVAYNVWLLKLFSNKNKYLITGTAYALGSSLFGKTLTPSLFAIYSISFNTTYIGLYLSSLSLLTFFTLLLSKDQH